MAAFLQVKVCGVLRLQHKAPLQLSYATCGVICLCLCHLYSNQLWSKLVETSCNATSKHQKLNYRINTGYRYMYCNYF